MLEVVDERVLERGIEQRREVADPHDPGEERPRRRPGTPAPARPASGGPAGSSGGARPASTTRRSSVIGAARAMSGAATSISRRCWTMWTENSVVS